MHVLPFAIKQPESTTRLAYLEISEIYAWQIIYGMTQHRILCSFGGDSGRRFPCDIIDSNNFEHQSPV